MAHLDTRAFAALVAAASQAPTADNRSTFRVENAGDRVRLWTDEPAAPRHRRILDSVAIGAAVENIRLRAGRLGFEATPHWRPRADEPGLAAEILLLGNEHARPDPLESLIERRHTNRRVIFRGPPLSAGQLGDLSTEAASEAGGGIQLHWFDAPGTRKQVLRLLRIAETDRFRSRDLHEELFSAVRFDVGWKAGADDGLPPGALEVEPLMRPMFRALRHWRLVRALHAVGAQHLLGLRVAYLPCRTAPHVGALTMPTEAPDPEAGAFAAGSVFERVWLRTTQLGMELQPFAAPAVLSLTDCEWASPKARAALAAGWRRLTPGRVPIIVFRVGRASAPSVRTARQPLEAYCHVPPESAHIA